MRPLVAPGPELTPEQAGRYSRHLLLPQLADDGQRRLRAARVLVVGAGGLGSPVIAYLAAAGIGTIGVVDDDVVATTNLQRQVLHRLEDVGRPKAESAVDAVARLNPEVRVVPHRLRLTAENALDLLRDYDLVVDGADNFPTRYLVGDACTLLGLPCVWGSVYRFDGQVSVFWNAPPDDAGPVVYRDVFPVPPAPGLVPSCAEGGVLGALCGAIGSAMATEVVKLVCGTGEPLLGRILVHDALEASWRTVRVRSSGVPPVTELTDYEAFCGVTPPAGGLDEVPVAELARLLDARDRGDADFLLVDVREPAERAIAVIPGAVPIPIGRFRSGEALAELDALAAGRRVVLHCKTGGRSAEAVRLLRAAGRDDVAHVPGGVLAWVDEIDPGQPRY